MKFVFYLINCLVSALLAGITYQGASSIYLWGLMGGWVGYDIVVSSIFSIAIVSFQFALLFFWVLNWRERKMALGFSLLLVILTLFLMLAYLRGIYFINLIFLFLSSVFQMVFYIFLSRRLNWSD